MMRLVELFAPRTAIPETVHRMLKNPSVTALLGLLRRSEYKELRGLVVRDNLWWWDANMALHGDIADHLNHPDYTDDRLNLRLTQDEARIDYPEPWTFAAIKQHAAFARLTRSPLIYFYEPGHGWLTGPQWVAIQLTSA